MDDERKELTTNFGAPVPNNQDSLTTGPRGPMLLQDICQQGIETLADQTRHITNCLNADPAYGEGVAAALGIPMSEVWANPSCGTA
jgi:catalase